MDKEKVKMPTKALNTLTRLKLIFSEQEKTIGHLRKVHLWPTWKLILKYTTCTCSAPCPCAAAFLEVQRVGLWSQTWKGRSAAGHQTRASRNQTSPASLPCSRWPTSAGTKRGRRWWGGSRAYSMHANVTWVKRNLTDLHWKERIWSYRDVRFPLKKINSIICEAVERGDMKQRAQDGIQLQ